jgi:hypothetical protein
VNAARSHKRQAIGWDVLIADLQAASLSLRQIQRLTGISKSALHRFAHGCEPGHADGSALLGLWREATSAAPDAMPPVQAVVAIRRARQSYRADSGPDSGRQRA